MQRKINYLLTGILGTLGTIPLILSDKPCISFVNSGGRIPGMVLISFEKNGDSLDFITTSSNPRTGYLVNNISTIPITNPASRKPIIPPSSELSIPSPGSAPII